MAMTSYGRLLGLVFFWSKNTCRMETCTTLFMVSSDHKLPQHQHYTFMNQNINSCFATICINLQGIIDFIGPPASGSSRA